MDNEYREIRLEKAAALRAAGINPYAVRTPERKRAGELRVAFEKHESAALEAAKQALGSDEIDFNNLPEDAEAKGVAKPSIPGAVAGRVLAMRAMGKKVAFIDVWSEDAKIQLFVHQNNVGEDGWTIFENLDLGDFLWASGDVQRTKTGEISLFANGLKFLSKAIAVPPLEKSGGLKDIETRYRKRYADLLASPDKRAVFATRSAIVARIRSFLNDRAFMEVETPMMHPIPGGASARPFITHHNALDMELYMRIAPELYLKRLLVGGFEKVYEINRNFRNEGIDHTHNPEFTMLELYEAYGDYHSIMDLTEAMLVDLIDQFIAPVGDGQKIEIQWGEQTINMTPPFRRAGYGEVFTEHTGVDMENEGAVRALAKKLPNSEEVLKLDHWKIVDELFDEHVQDKLIDPVFIIDYPKVISPLAKQVEGSDDICERFEIFINGMEFANAFSELNDPVEQLARFESQVQKAIATGDVEAPRVIDHDYVEALEYGMPPAGGLGLGIDRLVMLLTNQISIRDVLLFPHMRKEQGAE